MMKRVILLCVLFLFATVGFSQETATKKAKAKTEKAAKAKAEKVKAKHWCR